MTRTDYNGRTSENVPSTPLPLPRYADRRDTRGYVPDDWYAPDPDAEYEARFETASDRGSIDD